MFKNTNKVFSPLMYTPDFESTSSEQLKESTTEPLNVSSIEKDSPKEPLKEIEVSPSEKSERKIPDLTSSEMTNTILLRLGDIEQSIRHKNTVIDKLKQIQDEITFILSETDKLTSSDQPLTLENLTDLTQIYALVEHIFDLMDKNSSDKIDQDINDMITKLGQVRNKIITVNATLGNSSGSSGNSGTSTASSGTSTTSTTTTTTTPPTNPPTKAFLTTQNSDQLSGKDIITATKTIQLDEEIIKFTKNYLEPPPTGYDGLGGKPNEFATNLHSEISSIDGTTFNGLTASGLEIKLQGSFPLKLKENKYTIPGESTTYCIYSRPPKTGTQFSKRVNGVLVLYDGGQKYFFFKPKQNNNEIMLFVPSSNNGYIKIDKLDPKDSGFAGEDVGLTKIQLGGKKYTKKNRKNKKKTLRFL
jgi:hypothetical protein